MYKIIKANEGTVRQIADNKSANNLITKDDTSAISLATTEGEDFYEREITKYNRIYFVLEGNLELVFSGESHQLSVGDACYMDSGTEYEMKGTFKAVVVNQPAFGT
jgi:ethanolamine utilization protein EutQ (cupin superfamily)